ncbi:fatty acid desaturase [Aestuariibius sp. HNIBRBA575]|uniref:fatty acid desaturase n=1 Tax=Aestuariibius sp. HNIBRBA575 TaxID=3233343 RepID=UPI0034A5795C
MNTKKTRVEWPTLWLIVACYLVWIIGIFAIPLVSIPLAILITATSIALHSSLQHEVIHGHPFASQRVNAALILSPLTLLIPYARFRDSHLAHHRDSMLTDPYDDPESNYMDPAVWATLPGFVQLLLRVNNTLAGRMVVGPLIGQMCFMLADWRAIRAGDRVVLRGWLWHIPATLVVVLVITSSALSIWAYFCAAYLGLSLLKIRTFLEHQAHEKSRARTVIIQDRGPLAFLFLNNNLHVVHHMHPRMPWYQLPDAFDRNPNRYLRINEHYSYATYAEIFRRHLFRAKDPVPHPLWPRG